MNFDPCGSRHVDGAAIIERLAADLGVSAAVLRAALENVVRAEAKVTEGGEDNGQM